MKELGTKLFADTDILDRLFLADADADPDVRCNLLVLEPKDVQELYVYLSRQYNWHHQITLVK